MAKKTKIKTVRRGTDPSAASAHSPPAEIEAWLRERRIDEVECLVPDMAGICRGKILPRQRFVESFGDRTLRLPEAVFVQTVTGEYPVQPITDPAGSDIFLAPDPGTIRVVPWYEEPTAQVITDCFYADGSPVDISPRQVLRSVLAQYAERGWAPVVAPELEFFVVKVNADADYPLEPPIGRSGRAETGRQAYGIEAVNEFDPLFEDVYDYCEAQEIDIDTLSHEAGAAQMEINFNHGDALLLADQVLLFKRTVRQAALKHGVYATFMAKPHQDEPGSSMHLHMSVVDARTGENIFGLADGGDSDLFRHYLGGLQRYLPAAMPLLAPNVNSYRRLVPYSDAPVNVQWGLDNRTTGLRVPLTSPGSRRVENRVAGADVNPYLAFAASLACGLLGIEEELEPGDPVEGNAYSKPVTLPESLHEALKRLSRSKPLHDKLGKRFCKALHYVKAAEDRAYRKVISAWEREHLLLNV